MIERRDKEAGARLPLWKKALFSVVVFGLFFAGLEATLWAVGVRPVLYDEDPFVGFSSRIPLFERREGRAGEPLFVTATLAPS